MKKLNKFLQKGFPFSHLNKMIDNLNEVGQSVANLNEVGQSVANLNTIEGEITSGKEKIALAITAKGVPTDPKASFNDIADNVGLIQKESYTIDGGDLYEKQMFGGVTESIEPYVQTGAPLWNLYEVMATLLSDSRFTNYGGILLAEYYKGYDTIELMNAGASGAYFTCDGDFYTTDRAGENAHVWHDGDNNMLNRWVAYLFAAPDSNYTIPNENLCPRSIHIGREVGALICNYNSRFDNIIVTDGNSLREIRFSEGILTFNNANTVVLRNIKKHTTGSFVNNVHSTQRCMIADVKIIDGAPLVYLGDVYFAPLEYLECGVEEVLNNGEVVRMQYNSGSNLKEVRCPKLRSVDGYVIFIRSGRNVISALKRLYLPSLLSINNFLLGFSGSNTYPSLLDVEVGEVVSNLNCYGWNPTNVLSTPEGIATINANIRDHIAAKVSDRTGQTTLTFTVSTNLYNNFEQETLDAFAAKNWRVAGA